MSYNPNDFESFIDIEPQSIQNTISDSVVRSSIQRNVYPQKHHPKINLVINKGFDWNLP